MMVQIGTLEATSQVQIHHSLAIFEQFNNILIVKSLLILILFSENTHDSDLGIYPIHWMP